MNWYQFKLRPREPRYAFSKTGYWSDPMRGRSRKDAVRTVRCAHGDDMMLAGPWRKLKQQPGKTPRFCYPPFHNSIV